jgi:hypothetical protein
MRFRDIVGFEGIGDRSGSCSGCVGAGPAACHETGTKLHKVHGNKALARAKGKALRFGSAFRNGAGCRI